MRTSLPLTVLALACAAWVQFFMLQEPAPAPAPPPAPAASPSPRAPSTPPQEPAPSPGGKAKPAPLTIEALDVLLMRAEQNLVRHGLSLDPRQVQLAATDYRAAVEGLPEGASADRRFTALFGLAFALARMDIPPDAAGMEARALEASECLDRASRLETSPPGGFSANPGLWIVDGLMRERVGDFATAEKQITLGLAKLEQYPGLQPWQVYQLRLFGYLARGRAFLKPPLNAEHLALKDFKEALKLADQAALDPLAPRNNLLRTTVLTHMAAAYQVFEYFEEAEKVLSELLRTDPNNPVHPYNMGLLKGTQQKYPEALACFRKSADLDRKDPRPRLKIAFILLRYPDPGKEPDIESAIREGEIYLNGTGGEPDAEYCSIRGEAAFHRKDMKGAESWYRKALGLSPECRVALQRLISILGQKEDPTDAVQKEIEELRTRLQNSGKKDDHGPGMQTKRSDWTFC